MHAPARPPVPTVADGDGFDGITAPGTVIPNEGTSSNGEYATPGPIGPGASATRSLKPPESDISHQRTVVRARAVFPIGTDARMTATIAWLPVWLAVSTVAWMYLLPELMQRQSDSLPPLLFVLAGLATGLLAWIGASAATVGEAVASRANTSSYAQLMTRIAEDEAIARRPGRGRQDLQQAALADLAALKACVDKVPPDSDWPSGIAYVAAWRELHAIEVDLVDTLDAHELDCALRHDEFRVDGSKLDKDSKVRTLLDEARRMLDKDPAADVASRVRAIREAVNEFRDRRFDALVRDRIRTDRMSLLLGLGAWSLLCLAIVAEAPRDSIAAVSALYLVGAATGLFTQLRSTSSETLENIFGYGQAQVRQMVLISGIAGIAGAFLAEAVTMNGGSDASSSFAFGIKSGTTIANALALSPGAVVAAAVFGFAPGILTDRLGAWAKANIKDLESTANAAGSQGNGT